jgi:hypothetical protein
MAPPKHRNLVRYAKCQIDIIVYKINARGSETRRSSNGGTTPRCQMHQNQEAFPKLQFWESKLRLSGFLKFRPSIAQGTRKG